jgi:hypothetical protein
MSLLAYFAVQKASQVIINRYNIPHIGVISFCWCVITLIILYPTTT